MDECMLNDLLECSVCLERLDTSSKVLPCQHTFCKRCLEEIVTTHKELRCPECRILVDAKIDDLPPNVLLMRILEGMRNAPKKQQTQEHTHRGGTNIRTTLTNTHQSSVIHQHSATESQQIISTNVTDRNQVSSKGQVTQILPHQPYGRALYDYVSSESEDLSFKKGDIILLKKRMDMHWYLGECGGKQGVFPSAFIQIMIPLPCQTPQCKALYDFRMTGEDEEGCLAFNKGAIINVIRRVDENWAEGRLNDRVGIFPLAFVELNSLARSLMKLSSNSQPGPSRIAPPTPTNESNTPLISADYVGMQSSNITTRSTFQQAPQQQQSSTPLQQQQQQQQQQQIQQTQHYQQQQQQPQPQQQQPPKRQSSDSSSTVSSTSPSTTPNTSSSNTSSSSSTAPSSPTSPPPLRSASNNVHSPPPRPTALHVSQTPQSLSTTVNQREKRHSFSAMNSSHHHHSSHRHSAEILSTDQNEISQTPQSSSDRHKRSSDTSVPPPVPPTQNGSSHHTISNTTNLPAAYIALYPYTPQKPDELELRKGGIYMVTERCQDGWFKGTSNRTQKCGVFPGNYVAPARGVPRGTTSNLSQVSPRNSGAPPLEPRILTTYTRSGKSSCGTSGNSLVLAQNIRSNTNTPTSGNSRQPPELPPRSTSPAVPTSTVSCSWHGQPENTNAIPLGRSQSAVMTSSSVTSPSVSVSSPISKTIEKSKDRKEKGTVSLMRRLTSMKRSKSPPPTTYSMDNPVFEDNTTTINTLAGQSTAHPVHVRSGSCPSQLLQALPPADMNTTSVLQNVHHRFLATGTLTGSQRIKHKERGHVMQIASTTLHSSSSRHGENSLQSSLTSSPNSNHRKSNSLDAGSKTKTPSTSTIAASQPGRERFRCIVPYPPNSEYELELRLNDIIYVHKKRDDGWYKGTQQRTGRTGLFPASFVESL